MTAAQSSARRLRDLLAGLRFPPGLPPLTVPLHLALVALDDPDAGFGISLGPGWTVTTTTLSPDLVHDAVLAAPVALVRDILTGVADPGWATVHGSVTGTLAGQSTLAFLLEATGDVASRGRST
jgi:hypothetical protein